MREFSQQSLKRLFTLTGDSKPHIQRVRPLVTDIFDLVAGPKQKQAAPQKDEIQAAEDQASFADQLAAKDTSDQQTSKSETNAASDTDSTDTQATSDAKADTQQPTVTDETDVSFQLFSQNVSEDTAKVAEQAGETLTTPVLADDASKQTLAAPSEEILPDPTITTAEEETASKKAASDQPDLVATASTQAQKAAGEAETAKPVETPIIGKTAEADITARTTAQAAANPDDAVQAPALATSNASFDEAIKVSATPINATGDATGTGIITATTQATPTTAQAPTVQIAQTPAAIPTPPQVVAVPEDIPRLITQAMTSEDAADRIVIQLDPPELGRVSLDFKLDANGVQTVTVTAETPEAIKKLRMMNFELIQAMEQNGLNSGGFGLDYQQSQSFAQYEPGQTFTESDSETSDTDSIIRLSETALYRNPQTGETGLNLKL